MIRLVVVDDQKLFLDLMRRALDSIKNIEVIALFQSSRELFSYLNHTSPDVLLLDVEIPSTFGDDGFEIAQKVKEMYPEIKIISISVNTQSYVIRRLIKTIGVHGFIDKNNTIIDDIKTIIEIVNQGHFYIDADLEKKARRIFEMELLTAREKEVVHHIIDGKSNKDVAEVLNLSLKTIDNHRQNIFLKLECSKVTELAQKYYFFKYLQSDTENFLPNFKKGT